MPSRTEQDADPPFAQEVVRPHQVVDAFYLVVDMLDAGVSGREQRDFVVDLVDSQQRRLADPVTYLCIAKPRPERFVARRIGRAQADVAEAGDAGIARWKIAATAMVGRDHEIDAVARRITKVDEGTNPS
ncbi:hypothetical protein D9M72_579940 [compost metagenome]